MRNSSSLITCFEETAVFTCTVPTPRVEWIAEPYFSRSAQFQNSPGANGIGIRNDYGPYEGIIVRQVDTSPLMTEMIIQGNLINESFNASCIPQFNNGILLTNETETEKYVPACT